MSKYAEFDTKMTDAKHLSAALTAMGFEHECHGEPQTLIGYAGDERTNKAHIIIRKHNTGIDASNDIGFLRGEDGTFKAVLSDYDRSVKFDDSWLGKLKQGYAECKTMALAAAKGYRFCGKDLVQTAKGTSVKLRFMARG